MTPNLDESRKVDDEVETIPKVVMLQTSDGPLEVCCGAVQLVGREANVEPRYTFSWEK